MSEYWNTETKLTKRLFVCSHLCWQYIREGENLLFRIYNERRYFEAGVGINGSEGDILSQVLSHKAWVVMCYKVLIQLSFAWVCVVTYYLFLLLSRTISQAEGARWLGSLWSESSWWGHLYLPFCSATRRRMRLLLQCAKRAKDTEKKRRKNVAFDRKWGLVRCTLQVWFLHCSWLLLSLALASLALKYSMVNSFLFSCLCNSTLSLPSSFPFSQIISCVPPFSVCHGSSFSVTKKCLEIGLQQGRGISVAEE